MSSFIMILLLAPIVLSVAIFDYLEPRIARLIRALRNHRASKFSRFHRSVRIE